MEAVLKRELTGSKTLNMAIGVCFFLTLTALGAFVRVPLPFTPVPITLQTFFVLLSGAFLGRRSGSFTQLLYLVTGVCGAPIFTGAASGWIYLLGPTGGYFFGFILAAFFTGRFIGYSEKSPLRVFGLFFLADLLLLSCGSLWLKVIAGISFQKALLIGFLPFIAPDLLKAAAAALIFFKLRSRLKEIFSA